MQTILILATGTDAGKTYTSRRLAEAIALRWGTVPVAAVKPIETGVTKDALTDAALLAESSKPKLKPHHAYSFVPPISPHLASRNSNTPIRINEITQWVREHDSLQKPDGWIIVETAGGVFTPLSDGETNLDLALALEPSLWVLIAPDCLGVLHNVRSTLLAMERLARRPDVILLNAPETADNSTGTNRAELERLGWARITGSVARNGGFNEADTEQLLLALERFAASTPVPPRGR